MDKVISYLYSFLDLPKGWHYGEGNAPSRELVILVEQLISLLSENGAEVFEVFPGVDGYIVVSAFKDKQHIDISCYSLTCFDFLLEENDEELKDLTDLSYLHLLEEIKSLSWQQKRLSASSTSLISAMNLGDLKAHALKIHPITAAYP